MLKAATVCLFACLVLVPSVSTAGDHEHETVVSGTAILRVPDLASGTRCFYPFVPRPAESRDQIKARLEAAGQWRASSDPSRTPPADPQVNDSWLWYIWDLGGYPVANLKPCTVRGMGANCYVVVDDDEWNVTIDQADVDRIVSHFEDQSVGTFPAQGIWDLNTSHFGDPPNPLDNLDRVFLLYYRFDISADGFFWVYDQFPDGSQPFESNEADVVYLATDSGDPASNYMLGVAAHEFEHMIHYNHDSNESSWVDEGLAELAMWLFGNPDTISGFPANPDNSLTDWGGDWSDYIQTYLWTLYAYEQFGGQPTIFDLVHEPLNSMGGYLAVLTNHGYSVTMENVFRDWGVANFLDDPAIPDGEYGYVGETLPPFTAYRHHATYPASFSGSVQHWATDYIRLTGFTHPPTLLFDGDDGRDFRVSFMALDAAQPTLVDTMHLDDLNNGYFEFLAAEGYDEVIISVANVHPSAGGSYSYTADTIEALFADGFESGDTSRWSAEVP